MTTHPLSETAVAELWDAHRDPGVFPFHAQGRLYVRSQTAMLRAAFDAGREHEREHYTATDPHHDPRPWQDCTREDIRAGDLVEARVSDLLYVGVAHHRDEWDDWWTEDDYLLTDGDYWSLRRIPAPAPPAEEITLPTEPHLLTDVVLYGGEKIDEATWTGAVLLYARHPLAAHLVVAPADQIERWTLDGTRAIRDGQYEDGTPRFVKEDA